MNDSDQAVAKWGARDTDSVSPAPHFEQETLWDGAGPMPERTLVGNARVPDLPRIATARWAEVLGPLPERLRIEATLGPGMRGQGAYAFELALSLPPAPSDRARAALADGVRIPTPSAIRSSRRGRQISLRITHDEYSTLEVAAHLLGAKPTQIARMLILNGVRRVLAEHDAAIAGAGRPG